LLSSFGAFRNRVKLTARRKQATVNISEWWRGLEVAQYEPDFRENVIGDQAEGL